MRRPWGLVLVEIVLLMACACTTEEPLQSSGQTTAQITFTAEAKYSHFTLDVWDAVVDLDGNGVPEQRIWCQQVDAPVAYFAYPMEFSVEIDRVAAGSSKVERLTDARYSANLQSITPPYPNGTPIAPLEQAVDVPDPRNPSQTIRLALTNGRRLTTGSLDYLLRLKIPRSLMNSQCPEDTLDNSSNIGAAEIAGKTPPFTIRVNRGDTVIVKARKSPDPLLRVKADDNEIRFLSDAAVLGVPGIVTTGTRESPTLSEDGIAYSFTVR